MGARRISLKRSISDGIAIERDDLLLLLLQRRQQAALVCLCGAIVTANTLHHLRNFRIQPPFGRSDGRVDLNHVRMQIAELFRQLGALSLQTPRDPPSTPG